MSEKNIVVNRGLVKADFSFWVGAYLDKLYDAFEAKKIVGNKCPKCGDTYVPPRKKCGKCNVTLSLEENWVDLPGTGELINYTTTPYRVTDRRARKAKDYMLGMVKLDTTSSAIVYPLLDLKPEDVKIGMKVKVQWVDTPKGEPGDIKGFIPV